MALALEIGGCTALGGDEGTGDGPPDFAVSFARKGAGKVEIIIDGGTRIADDQGESLALQRHGESEALAATEKLRTL